jgi:cytochrome c oxidase cbb3-type subunit 3
MPRFGLDNILSDEEISDAAEYVLRLSGRGFDAAAAERGAALYAANCAACHGDVGTGNRELGAPNLTDAIWLFGGDKADIVTSIRTGRVGVMPGWAGRLDAETIKKLAIYVHSLGGGEK